MDDLPDPDLFAVFQRRQQYRRRHCATICFWTSLGLYLATFLLAFFRFNQFPQNAGWGGLVDQATTFVIVFIGSAVSAVCSFFSMFQFRAALILFMLQLTTALLVLTLFLVPLRFD